MFYVGHTAIAYFHCIPVQDFVKFVFRGEAFVQELEELFPNVGFYVAAIRGVEPCYVPRPFSPFVVLVGLLVGFVFQFEVVTTFF